MVNKFMGIGRLTDDSRLEHVKRQPSEVQFRLAVGNGQLDPTLCHRRIVWQAREATPRTGGGAADGRMLTQYTSASARSKR